MISINQNQKRIYEPIRIASTIFEDGIATIEIFNESEIDKANIGIYISAPKNLGEGHLPADFDGYIDWGDIIKWGNEHYKLGTQGGLSATLSSGEEIYFSGDKGSQYSNRIKVGVIYAGNSTSVKLKLYTPLSVSSRRLYISVNAE